MTPGGVRRQAAWARCINDCARGGERDEPHRCFRRNSSFHG